MMRKIKHSGKLALLFLAIGVNTTYGIYTELTNKVRGVNEIIENVKAKDHLRAFKGGELADPDNYSNF